MKIAVEIDGTTTTYIVTPRAQVEFERKFGIGLGEMSGMEHVYYVAYAAAKSAGATTADYDTWLDTLEGAETVKDDAPLDETPPSSESPS